MQPETGTLYTGTLHTGMAVYGTDQQQIGTVSAANDEGIQVGAEQIPRSAITHVEGDRVYLKGASSLYRGSTVAQVGVPGQGAARLTGAVAPATADDAPVSTAGWSAEHRPGGRDELIAARDARERAPVSHEGPTPYAGDPTTTATGHASTTDPLTVIGVFEGVNDATAALNDLQGAGFTPEQISVVARERDAQQRLVEQTDLTEDNVVADVGAGAGVGAVLGGVAGWLVGISAVAIPGVGPIVGAGILGSTLLGAGVGAAAGGLVGALTSHGVPEAEARGYEEQVRQGSILLTVHAHGDAQVRRARSIFDGHNGRSVRSYGIEER